MKKNNSFILFTFFFSFCTVVCAQIGSPAPDFTVTDTHGETHTLYDYLEDGKTVVLDFSILLAARVFFIAHKLIWHTKNMGAILLM